MGGFQNRALLFACPDRFDHPICLGTAMTSLSRLLALALTLTLFASTLARAADRPNILMIAIDDQNDCIRWRRRRTSTLWRNVALFF
jgi:hypothetical protein